MQALELTQILNGAAIIWVAGCTGLDDSTNAFARQYGQESALAGLSEGGGLAGFGETGAAVSAGAGGGDTVGAGSAGLATIWA